MHKFLSIVSHITRSRKIKARAKPHHEAISGDSAKCGSKLFSKIVGNSASTTAKRSGDMGTMEYINIKTRGKAVAIGPLEYCGNGIPLKQNRGKVADTGKGTL